MKPEGQNYNYILTEKTGNKNWLTQKTDNLKCLYILKNAEHTDILKGFRIII